MIPSFPVFNIQSNDGYHDRIVTLFCMLDEANRADHSDMAAPWQKPNDASHCHGYYGHIHNAIKAIAGTRIIDHWCDCHELDLSLADRNPPKQRRYRIRFNLEAGKYKGWWLIQDMIDPDNQNQPQWVNPASRSLFMSDCKLTIDTATATRICNGTSSKRACAWIECDELQVIHTETALQMLDLSFTHGASVISFNPRVTPHWMYNGKNADDYELDHLVTSGKTVYQYE
jgi:hypothetical protein